jgi:hypothetical protein
VLSADQEALRDLVEETGRLLAKVVLLELAVHRIPDGVELTESRLAQLATDLREAVEDGRATLSAWQQGR